MEDQKRIKFLDKTLNQLSKFRTRNWTQIDDEASWTYNTNSHIKFKITMLESCLWNDNCAYILLKRTITVVEQEAGTAAKLADLGQ